MKIVQPNFQAYLKQSSGEIEKELHKYSKDWDRYIKTNFSDLKKENEKFKQSLIGGKMIRGTLIKLGYELFQNKNIKAIFKPAVAFELLHTSLLIHDDIIDQTPVRRGKPSLYVSRNKHYGISQAICLGDLGITLSIKLLSESNFQIQDRQRALDYFLHTITTTILGEMLDIKSAQRYKCSEEQVLKIQQTKTANYTIIAPLTIGAIFAGAEDTVLTQIKYFGENLGVAFQIKDDILGIYGDERILGKSTTSDIEENKNTLLFTYALKRANQKQKNILKKYYGKKKITPEQHEMIKQVFQETRALAYCEEKLNKLIDEAKTSIPAITNNKYNQTLLAELSDLLISRNK